jgi:hypothetical protein
MDVIIARHGLYVQYVSVAQFIPVFIMGSRLVTSLGP